MSDVIEHFLASPLFLILAGALLPTILGVLTYRQAVKADRVAEQSGIASDQHKGVAQVIEGLNSLADNLQIDNKELRAAIRECAGRLAIALAERDELLRQARRLPQPKETPGQEGG